MIVGETVPQLHRLAASLQEIITEQVAPAPLLARLLEGDAETDATDEASLHDAADAVAVDPLGPIAAPPGEEVGLLP